MAGPRWRLARALLAPALAGILVAAALVYVLVVMIARQEERPPHEDQACRMNLHSLAMAFHMYALDNGGRFPPAARWVDALTPAYVVDPTIFHCPVEADLTYAMNANLGGASVDQLREPGRTLLLFHSTLRDRNPHATERDGAHFSEPRRSLWGESVHRTLWLSVDWAVQPWPSADEPQPEWE
jgi:hypothetical protein